MGRLLHFEEGLSSVVQQGQQRSVQVGLKKDPACTGGEWPVAGSADIKAEAAGSMVVRNPNGAGAFPN